MGEMGKPIPTSTFGPKYWAKLGNKQIQRMKVPLRPAPQALLIVSNMQNFTQAKAVNISMQVSKRNHMAKLWIRRVPNVSNRQ